jgi:glycosyltransferase involved in cell wall biosynthesis/Ser/Thr protein kinase RdoA (MazF antagonist)
VVVSRFPLVTETFVLREIIELERQGQPVLLVPLLRERPAVVHPEARPWVRRALYTPLLSPAIAGANARALVRRPLAYLRLLGALVRGTAASPGTLARTAALFPKMVYLAERLAAEGVGHVHAHFVTHPGTAAFVVHRLAGIPYSLTAHAHDIFVRRDMLERKIAGARFVRCVSAFNRDFLAKHYPRHAQKLEVVHVGVEVRAGEEPVARAPGPARLLCVAALKPYKGHVVLLEALGRLRARGADFECDLVGDGPLRADVERAVAASGLSDRVRVLGALTQQEVAALLASATALVQPSVVARDGQMEGIPVALMEALAARKPVVASALSGIPELVEDGVSGLLVPPGDAEALASSLERLLREPALAAWLGEQGRRRVVREFDLQGTARAVLGAIDAHREPPPAGWAERLRDGAFSWPVVGLRRVHERRDSSVAEILLPRSAERPEEGPHELVLKVHQRPGGEPSPAAARREFETLVALEKATAPAGAAAAPRALGIDVEAAAVLMTACRGEPLSDRVRRLRWERAGPHAAVLDDVRRTGAWLRAFQQFARDGAAPALVEPFIRAAEADAEAAALPRRLQARVRARLREIPGRVDGAWMTHVGVHGDLWPGNVFVHDGGVEVVDLEGFGRGFAYEDAAYFLAQLGLFYSYPGLRGRRERAAAAFFEGYLEDRPLDRAAWALCWTAKVLRALARTDGTTRRGPLRAWWRRHALLAMLEAEP